MAFSGKIFLAAATFMLTGAVTLAGTPPLKYTMSQMDLRDMDALNQELGKESVKCSKIKGDDAYLDCMATLVEVTLSRRDQNDGTNSKLFNLVLFKMEDASRTSVLKRIANRSIDRLKDASVAVEQRATSVEVLKNLIAEADPSRADQRPALEILGSTPISIADDVKEFRDKRFMLKTPALTERAKEVLAKAPAPAPAPTPATPSKDASDPTIQDD